MLGPRIPLYIIMYYVGWLYFPTALAWSLRLRSYFLCAGAVPMHECLPCLEKIVTIDVIVLLDNFRSNCRSLCSWFIVCSILLVSFQGNLALPATRPVVKPVMSGYAMVDFDPRPFSGRRPWDMTGAKHLWWTWHTTDQTLENRFLGVPLASSHWTMIFCAVYDELHLLSLLDAWILLVLHMCCSFHVLLLFLFTCRWARLLRHTVGYRGDKTAQ